MFDHSANNIHAMCGSTIPAEPRAPKVIVPTIGRQVWFWKSGKERLESLTNSAVQPHAATVVHVWGDRCVNLQVLNGNGIAYSECSVTLVQPEDPWNEETGPHAQWMPYQVGQAAKTEAATGRLLESFARQAGDLRVADIGVDANGSPVPEGEQLSRDLTDQARAESLGG